MGILSFIKGIFSKKKTQESPITISDEFKPTVEVVEVTEVKAEAPKMAIKKKAASSTKEKQIDKPKATKKSTPKKDK